MAPKWIDLSECMQCFKSAGQRCKQASSCLHISSVSRLHITCISSLPAMTDTDASACNPPTNPFVCTHHLPQIPLGKIHCQSIAGSNTSIQPWACFFLISSSGNAVQSRFLASACSLCNSYYRAPLLLPYSSYTRSFFFLIHLTPKVVFALLTILSWQCHLRCC